ncbi:MAG: hypothetical protein ACKVP2_17590 [Burkholderiales bacterium]
MGTRMPAVVEVAYLVLVLPVATAYVIGLATVAWIGIQACCKRLHRSLGPDSADAGGHSQSS